MKLFTTSWLLLATVLFASQLTAQSVATINPNSANVTIQNCGDSATFPVQIINSGSSNLSWNALNNTIISENFETAVGSFWNVFGGGISNLCGVASGNGALRFNSSGTRLIESSTFSSVNGINLDFALKISVGGSNCEDADPGEEVVLEYSTDGGFNWNLASTYFTTNYSNYTNISASIPQLVGVTAGKIRLRQLSNSGQSYDNWAIDNLQLTIQNTGSNIVTPNSGTVMPNDTAHVLAKVRAQDLQSGNYTSYLYFQTNDPSNSYDSIQVNLTLVGAPDFSLSSSCLNFPTIQENDTRLDSIQIINTGCDDLNVSNITNSLAEYTVLNTSFSVIPDDTFYVKVRYSPTSIGTFNDTLNIVSNMATQVKCLSGMAVGAPSISYNPIVVNQTINSCNDSVVVPISFYNTGNGPLNISTQNSTNSNLNATYLRYDFENGMPNWDYINNVYPINVTNTNPASGSSCLDVRGSGLVLRKNFTPDSINYMSIKVRYENISASSTVQFGSNFTSSNSIFSFERYNPNSYRIWTGTGLLTYTPPNMQDWVQFELRNIDWINYTYDIYINGNIFLPNASFWYTSSQPFDVLSLISNNTSASTFYDDIQIGTKPLPAWMGISPDSLTVLANDSGIINLTLKSTGLENGTYSSPFIITTNDPTNPTDSINVNFTVNGTAVTDTDPSCVNFSNVMENSTAIDSFYVYNIGCDVLTINSISTNLSEFTVLNHSHTISPLDSSLVRVSFAPTASGTFNDTMIFHSNAAVHQKCISGIAVGAPILSFNPTSISQTINSCNDSIVVPISIYNTGNGPLTVISNSRTTQASNINNVYYGFESGMPAWDYTNNTYPPLLSSTNPASGNFSLEIFGSGRIVNKALTPDTTSYISFKMRLENVNSSGTMQFGQSTVNPYSLFAVNRVNSTSYRVFTNSGSSYIYTPTNIYGWTHFELKNIDYINKTYDLYIDGVLFRGSTFFYNISTQFVDLMEIYANNLNGSIFYDDIQIGGTVLPNWMSLSPDSLTVMTNDTGIMNLTLRSTDLENGTYTNTIFFNSNDPLKTVDSINVSLMVNGTPNINTSASCINFNNVTQFTSKTDSIVVYNFGCDTLSISSMTSANSFYSFTINSINVAPYDSTILYATFNPTSVGNQNDTLTINSNTNSFKVCLLGDALLAPSIVYSPRSYTDTLVGCKDSVTFPVTFRNTGGDTLKVSIGNGNRSSLDSLISKIQSNHTSITNNIPNMYAFFEGITGNNINDGGGDMYDGGNYLNTNFSSGISYSNNLVTQSTAFGASGKYFTSKVNGLFVMAAELDQINTFSITGNLGADGSGSVTTSILNTVANGTSYTGFTKTVFNSGDPNINHLIIVESSVGATRTYQTNTNNENHTVANLTSAKRIYYLLYANNQFATPMTNSQNLAVMNSFLSLVTSSSEFDFTFAPNQFNLLGGDSIVVSAKVKSSNLSSGTYNSTAFVHSNDPTNLLDSINLNITVQSSPQIGFASNCINFGNKFVNSTTTDSLLTYNSGCDTLRITGVVPLSTNFSVVGQSSFVLAPNDSAYIVVNYNPTALGNHNSLMRIFNNDMDSSICFTAAAVPAPTAVVNPNFITASVDICDTLNVPITIFNTGGSDLEYEVGGSASSTSTLEIVALTHGVDVFGEYANLRLGINSYFTNYNITDYSTLNSSGTLDSVGFKQLLTSADIILVPEVEVLGSANAYTSLFPAIRNFVSSGGSIIYCAPRPGNESVLFNSGLVQGTINGNISGNLTINNASHPILVGTTSPITSANASVDYNITSSNIDVILSSPFGANPVVFTRPFGSGKIAVLGFDYYLSNTNVDKIAANAIQWAGKAGNRLPAWIKATPQSDTVAQASNQTVIFTLLGNQLTAGQHVHDISIKTNDPANPEIIIPCTLTVNFTPCADFTFTKPNQCSSTVNFTDQTTNSPTSWSWDFGDGNISSQRNPSHTYSMPGSYTVTLVAGNSQFTDTSRKVVSVNGMYGSFTTSGPRIINSPISFTAVAPGAVSYYWNFGNGQVSSLANPTTTYTSTGNYPVTLISINAAGCNHVYNDTLRILLTGVENQIISSNEIQIHPNPSEGVFKIFKNEKVKIRNIRIYDQNGRLVKTDLSNDNEIDLTIYPSGIYNLILDIKGEQPISRKLIVR